MEAVRRLRRRFPGLDSLLVATRNRELRPFVLQLFAAGRHRLQPQANLTVSLTSFPARIAHAWIPILSIFAQDYAPSRVVLVLAEEEFPTRRLPLTLRLLQRHGLEVLWTARNLRSYNKLLLTMARYPATPMVTVDDDVIYEPWRLRLLVEAAHSRPDTIIGHRGWQVTYQGEELTPYRSWPQAGPQTPSERCLLTGVGGVLYPPGLLPDEQARAVDRFTQLCPTNDDIWYWALAQRNGIARHCLGSHRFRPLRLQDASPALKTTNVFNGANDRQLAAVCEAFGLTAETTL